MISEFFIDCGFGVLDGLFSKLPDMTWSVDTSFWQYAKDFLDMIAYLLPMNTIIVIVTLIFGVIFFRIFMAFVQTLLSLI